MKTPQENLMMQLPVTMPNPNYVQAKEISKQYGLRWVSVIEGYGAYEKVFRVKTQIDNKIFQIKRVFGEAMFEFSKNPHIIVQLELKRAIHDLMMASGCSIDRILLQTKEYEILLYKEVK